GTGLGLAIARQVAEAMNGEIGLESRMGRGSLFYFVVPVLPQLDEGEGKRVLVVEDHPINQRLAVNYVQRLGFESRVASSGKEAIQLLERESFDLILMDCQMPELDGYQTTAKIRGSREASHRAIPIVAMTAGGGAELRERCRRAGMDDFLEKPVKVEELGKVLRKHILGEESREVAMSVNYATWAKLQEFQNESDNRVFHELIDAFLENTPARIERMQEAARVRDASVLELQAHSLKSVSMALGAERLAHLCKDLEQTVAGGWRAEVPGLVEKVKKEYAEVHRLMFHVTQA
ncbi:MAG: response regulator, partial [Bdellovibrionota bacterium]